MAQGPQPFARRPPSAEWKRMAELVQAASQALVVVKGVTFLEEVFYG